MKNIMSKKFIQSVGLLVSFFIFCGSASAELYKCKDAKGKTLYSESPCPEKYIGGQIVLQDSPIESAGIKRLKAQGTPPPQSTAAALTTNSSSSSIDNGNLMSSHDKGTRLREISLDAKSMVASGEKKSDAFNEQRVLSNNTIYQLSYDDEQLRKNLKVDLNSDDRSVRYAALQGLKNIYRKYLNPN